jgi:hypothetical protein
MRTAQTIGNLIFGIMFMPWVWAEAIRLVAPKYHARMLALLSESSASVRGIRVSRNAYIKREETR